MTLEHGGKTVYGAGVGVLMLDTRFPRIFGDVGNARTWDFPVHYRVVQGAKPDKAVRGDPRELLDAFVEAGHDLVRMGCDGIVTNCGFLSLLQEPMKEALRIPVASSPLMQTPMVNALLPAGKRAGIVTISRNTLTEEHLHAAGAPPDTAVAGTDDGRSFTRDILEDRGEIDFANARLDLLDAATELTSGHEGIGAIVLECANMEPYAADIRKLTELPVFSIHTFVNWFHAGLAPRRFPPGLDDPRPGLLACGD